MIPDTAQSPPTSPPNRIQDDMVLAGYRECATEAMKWLAALGYEPGHPLMRSLAAHLTKKQAYLEKLELECFLVDQSLRRERDEAMVEDSEEEQDEEEEEEEALLRKFQEVRNDHRVQRALVEAVFRGCDLRYK